MLAKGKFWAYFSQVKAYHFSGFKPSGGIAGLRRTAGDPAAVAPAKAGVQKIVRSRRCMDSPYGFPVWITRMDSPYGLPLRRRAGKTGTAFMPYGKFDQLHHVPGRFLWLIFGIQDGVTQKNGLALFFSAVAVDSIDSQLAKASAQN